MESYTTHPEMCVIEMCHSSGGSCVPGITHYLKVFLVLHHREILSAVLSTSSQNREVSMIKV
jgi:hypothetical protein